VLIVVGVILHGLLVSRCFGGKKGADYATQTVDRGQQTVSVSATPGTRETEQTGGVFAEQVIRPTGLIDPPVEIKPVEEQVQ
ncbi:hypothetical protein LXJ59_25585, partial [Escherichia coli]|nr:hypothetical protein [Escherichia coli]